MIKVVTDSVASIPVDILADKSIEVATLYVNRDGKEYPDATMDIDAFYADIYDMVNNIPTSSQPSQMDFIKMFSHIANCNDTLLGVFGSSGLTGTYEGALVAAREVKKKIPHFNFALIDSRSCGFDEAFPVIEASNCVNAQKTLNQCIESTVKSIQSTRFLFTPENLTFLHKGGRIGNAATLIGNLIQLAPVISVVEGKAVMVDKARSQKKALDRILVDLKNDIERYGLKRIVVHYIGDKAPALAWAKEKVEPLVEKCVKVLPVSPVIGLHVGPAVGVVYECERCMPYKFPQELPSLTCVE